MNIYQFLSPMIPKDHSRQTRADDLVQERIASGQLESAQRVLDLGCGVGKSRDMFSTALPQARWTGVDIESSPEVDARTQDGDEFVTYDGTTLPFGDGLFDLVYSVQVFEHVRHPEKVLAEVARVMTPDGLFIGQTSQFEPYHSYSYWNFTIYGFVMICRDAGLDVTVLRPGIDGPTLIERSYLGRPDSHTRWFRDQSPLNVEIETRAREEGRSTSVANFRKLLYCGQFSFVCRKAAAT